MTTPDTGAADRRSRPVKRSFIIFSIIVTVLMAQIVWWIYYQISQNKAVYQLHQSALVIRVRHVVDEINRESESRLIAFTESNRLHADYRHGLKGDAVPPPLRQENFSTFYCFGDTTYYKDPTGIVISSVVDWKRLRHWLAERFPDLVVESLPQTRNEPYQYGPARVLRLPILVRPRTELIEAMIERTDRKTIMFTSEGAFFTLMVLAGVYLMYITLRKDLLLESQQKNFILSITHELKSPLAAIKLYLQTLLQKNVPAEKSQQFLRHSMQDVERLERLVENVLEAARMDRNEYHYTMTDVDLTGTVRRCLLRVAQYQDEEEVDVQTNITEGITVRGDEHALISVFDNLIENAVKYSTAPKQIRVSLVIDKTDAVFEIADNGAGIAAGDLPHLFDRFYRSGNEMTRTAKGTGIGLWIVAQVVRKHGGQVSAHSSGLEQGASFTVRFPLFYNRKG